MTAACGDAITCQLSYSVTRQSIFSVIERECDHLRLELMQIISFTLHIIVSVAWSWSLLTLLSLFSPSSTLSFFWFQQRVPLDFWRPAPLWVKRHHKTHKDCFSIHASQTLRSFLLAPWLLLDILRYCDLQGNKMENFRLRFTFWIFCRKIYC